MESLRKFDSFFVSQLGLISQLSQKSLEEKSEKRINQIFPLIGSLSTAGDSILHSVRYGLMTEAFIVARAFLERLVNACYLLVCDEKEFKDYVDYSMQKVYRSLLTKRKAYENIGHDVPVPDMSRIPIVAEGLKKFTSHRGKEITRWTTLRIEKRINLIGQRVKGFQSTVFLAAVGFLYEDASEAIHGTLYGSLFITGIFYGVPTKEDGERYLSGLRTMMFMLLGVLVDGLLHTAVTEIELQELVKASKENYAALLPHIEERKEGQT